MLGGGGAGAEVDEPVASGMLVVPAGTLWAPVPNMIASTKTAAPPRSADTFFTSDLIASSLSLVTFRRTTRFPCGYSGCRMLDVYRSVPEVRRARGLFTPPQMGMPHV